MRMKPRWRFWYKKINAIVKECRLPMISAYASGTTLFLIISFFPFMIMLLSLLRFLPFSDDHFSLISLDFIPKTVRELLISMVEELADNTSAAVLPIALLSTLWSASTGFVSLTRGLNAVYKREETRHFIRVRLMCILYTILFVVLLVAVLALLVFGNIVIDWLSTCFPLLSEDIFSVFRSRSVIAFVVMVLFFTLLYKTVPDRKARWFTEIPGAVVATVGWLVFSGIYSLYISGSDRVFGVYGSLTAVVLMMIWLYACIYILFIGAQINVFLQRSKKIGSILKGNR